MSMEPIHTHKARSARDPARYYTVSEWPDGRLACSCPDYEMRHAGKGTHCKHCRAVAASVKVAALAAAGVPSVAPEGEG